MHGESWDPPLCEFTEQIKSECRYRPLGPDPRFGLKHHLREALVYRPDLLARSAKEITGRGLTPEDWEQVVAGSDLDDQTPSGDHARAIAEALPVLISRVDLDLNALRIEAAFVDARPTTWLRVLATLEPDYGRMAGPDAARRMVIETFAYLEAELEIHAPRKVPVRYHARETRAVDEDIAPLAQMLCDANIRIGQTICDPRWEIDWALINFCSRRDFERGITMLWELADQACGAEIGKSWLVRQQRSGAWSLHMTRTDCRTLSRLSAE